jgi:hypothetical protein
VFSADAFTGIGTVDGARVACLSPQTQVLCHAQGYSPTEKDFSDMELLAQAFGVELPPLLQRARPPASADVKTKAQFLRSES